MTGKDDYQALSSKLATVLDKLQAGDVQVDDAVKLYEEGLTLITALEQHLQQAENKIEKLKLQSKV
ncbi:MAG TPA: exodeoxyribonuclease VII small subunit [Candidatus Saccharimonadales bacterium]